MGLFDPPFQFEYRCRSCRIRFYLERNTLTFQPRKCHKCGNRMEEKRCTHIGLNTDSTYMAGSHVDDGFGDDNRARKIARAKAKAAGVNPEGKKYLSQIATKRYDPAAWVSGRGDIARRCREIGAGCEGAVKVDAPMNDFDNPLDKPYQVNPDLVERHITNQEEDAGEKLGKQERADLKEKLTAEFSGAI